ncbi:MAG: hypothetical protein IJ191_02655, partial [Treponema sp.]|nr:hypothetical protein [Treponema sp.]
RRGKRTSNKAKRIGTACRDDSWSDLLGSEGEGVPPQREEIYFYVIVFAMRASVRGVRKISPCLA